MAFAERIELIKEIESQENSSVICFLTSLRPNVPGQIAGDAVRVFFDHLLLLSDPPVDRIDLFLVSNGGEGTVPWRLVALIREFARSFRVLVPYRAYSAASLLALGADEIIMHPFGELGPTDPQVSNEYNPKDEQTGQRIGIHVEDVTAYVNFIKNTVGIRHEDELVQAIGILATQVHPLALGNVERFISQSRMIARKLLRTHMGPEDEHAIGEIVENMASRLFFHGHPINRKEARDELQLKVREKVDRNLETLMWQLYLDYEAEFQNTEGFNPPADLKKQQLAMVANGEQETPPSMEYSLLHALVESTGLSSRLVTKRLLTLVPQALGQVTIDEAVLEQGWIRSPAP